MKWKDYWDKYPNQFKKDEFIKQVGKTLQGQPISEEQFNKIILDIIQKLEVNSKDRILDLCCGNGLITSALAEKCQHIVGVDFSKPLIEIAQEYHVKPNINYFNLSVLDITAQNIEMSKPFTKVYMYEALQYFQEDQLNQIIKAILSISKKNATILFTSIPNKSRLWRFYNTQERQDEYKLKKSLGTEAIGTWWSKKTIRQVCIYYGLQCDFLSQPRDFHTAHYRFDVKMKKII